VANGPRPTYVGGLGFGMKWDMGWMHDTLSYFSVDPIHRRYHHNQLTFRMLYGFTENFVLPLSHDEVVARQRFPHRQNARRRVAEICQSAPAVRLHVRPAGKKMLFMGCEFGRWREWHMTPAWSGMSCNIQCTEACRTGSRS